MNVTCMYLERYTCIEVDCPYFKGISDHKPQTLVSVEPAWFFSIYTLQDSVQLFIFSPFRLFSLNHLYKKNTLRISSIEGQPPLM